MFLPLHDANIIRHIRFPYVTYGLIGLTTLCFLLQALQPQAAFDQLTINFGMIALVYICDAMGGGAGEQGMTFL